MNVEETIQKIMKIKGLTRQEINVKIEEQITELSGLIDEEGAIVIVAKNLGIDLKENQEAANLEVDQRIETLKPRMNASIVGRLIAIEKVRTFAKSDGTEGMLLPFVLQDTTGMIRCVAWGEIHTQIQREDGFQKGEILRVVNGEVKEGRTGALEFHVGYKSRLQLQPDQVDNSFIPALNAEISWTPIGEISIQAPFVNIQGIVDNVFAPKPFTRKDNTQGLRASIYVVDATGGVYITFWGDHCDKMKEVKEEDGIKISKLTPKRNYRDTTQIDLTATSNTEIQKDSSIAQSTTKKQLKIIPIIELFEKGGDGAVEGKIQEIENVRTITKKDGSPLDLLKFVIADTTGAIWVILWGEQIPLNLKVGDVLLLKGVYTRKNDYSNQMELSLSRKGKIEFIDKQISTTKTLSRSSQQSSGPRKNIKEIQEKGFCEVKGTVIKEISRITTYRACSTCYKKEENCKCDQPGDIIDKMIANLIIDDGAETIRASLMGSVAENFMGKLASEIVQLKESGEIDDFLVQKSRDFLGKEYLFNGLARFSDYSDAYELNVKSFSEIDPERESKRIFDLLDS
jgi:ssDNA-binding replication factor A large subunit